jgi:molecular chaperone GrpE
MSKHKHPQEPPDPPEVLEAPSQPEAAPVEPAEDELERYRREAGEWHDQYLRTVAELKNVKRRHAEEAERIRDTATHRLVVSLLPVVDDLERALSSADEDASNPYFAGTQMVLAKLQGALRSVGVERITAVGQPFDHNIHEAVQPVPPSDEYPAGTVAAEFQPGYVQHGHVLRPAMVAVAHE